MEPNRHRVGPPVRENHFGMIKVDWAAQPAPQLFLRIVDAKNTVRVEETVSLATLRLPAE